MYQEYTKSSTAEMKDVLQSKINDMKQEEKTIFRESELEEYAYDAYDID